MTSFKKSVKAAFSSEEMMDWMRKVTQQDDEGPDEATEPFFASVNELLNREVAPLWATLRRIGAPSFLWLPQAALFSRNKEGELQIGVESPILLDTIAGCGAPSKLIKTFCHLCEEVDAEGFALLLNMSNPKGEVRLNGALAVHKSGKRTLFFPESPDRFIRTPVPMVMLQRMLEDSFPAGDEEKINHIVADLISVFSDPQVADCLKPGQADTELLENAKRLRRAGKIEALLPLVSQSFTMPAASANYGLLTALTQVTELAREAVLEERKASERTIKTKARRLTSELATTQAARDGALSRAARLAQELALLKQSLSVASSTAKQDAEPLRGTDSVAQRVSKLFEKT